MFRRGIEEKMEKKSRVLQGGVASVGFASHFSLLSVQTTYKKRFEEVPGTGDDRLTYDRDRIEGS